MKLFTEAFLDKWEVRATTGPEFWQTKTDSNMKWLAMAIHSDLRMQPTERYRLRRYLRQVAVTGLPVVAVIFAVWLFPLVFVWYKYPFVLHAPRYHKMLIGILSHSGFYIFPWLMLLLLAFNSVLYLPHCYFWNRRAERLRREPPLVAVQSETAATDISVWPPPPKRPVA